MIDTDLTGRIAIVTGGASGIGRAIVTQLARAGARVGFTHRGTSPQSVIAEIESFGGTVFAASLDATDPNAVTPAIESLPSQLGSHLDILVNNAGGLVARRPVATMSDAHWHAVVDLNLSSVSYGVRASLPFFREGGRIVNISSLAGHNGGGAGASAYAAAKAGVDGFTRALAKELGAQGIAVNAIAPGLILDTPFHEKFTPVADQQATIASTPMRRAGTPTDIASAVLYLVSNGGGFATGTVIDVNGGSYFG